jgi:hypothetical protein
MHRRDLSQGCPLPYRGWPLSVHAKGLLHRNDTREESCRVEHLVVIECFLRARAICKGDDHQEVADDETESALMSVRWNVLGLQNVLALM